MKKHEKYTSTVSVNFESENLKNCQTTETQKNRGCVENVKKCLENENKKNKMKITW